jgi:zinc protease
MRRMLKLALAAALVLAVCTQAMALDVQRKVTPEGLTVLHVQRDHLPMVVFTLLINAGAVREDPEQAGLAGLTASLIEEGTRGRTSTQISEELEFIGAGYSASASMDYTTMSLTVLKKDLKKGFDIFADMLLNPSFPKDEVVRIKELVKGSLKQREEEPSFLARKAFLKAVYGDHPYGRIVAGTPETVDAIGRDDIVEFHSKYYVPNNSIIAVVGDISGPELDRLLNRFFRRWNGKPVPPLEVPAPGKGAHEVVKIDKDLTQANVILGHLGVSRDNPDYYALRVMNYILGGGGFSSRLMDSVRADMGLAYDVHSFFSPGKLAGSFEAGVQTKNATANKAIAEILRQIRLIREEKVSGRELEDAKAFLIGSYPRKFDTMGKVAGFLVQVEFFGLGLEYIEEYPELIRAVTEDDILRVADEYLEPEDYVLVVVADQEEANIEDPAGAAQPEEQ